MARRLEITLSEERWAELDRVRGFEPRASFVKRALEKALDGLGSDQPTGGNSTEVPEISAPLPARPASPRASSLQPVAPRASSVQVPGVVRASSLVKRGVKPIPKGKS